MMALAPHTPGFQLTRAAGFHTLPTVSWSMKRPTRVPASTVVRMNRASNLIAKGYQKAFGARPKALLKISDMPAPGVGAPPVRAISVCSCTAAAAFCSAPGEMAKPRPLTACEADWTVDPTTAAGGVLGQ